MSKASLPGGKGGGAKSIRLSNKVRIVNGWVIPVKETQPFPIEGVKTWGLYKAQKHVERHLMNLIERERTKSLCWAVACATAIGLAVAGWAR